MTPDCASPSQSFNQFMQDISNQSSQTSPDRPKLDRQAHTPLATGAIREPRQERGQRRVDDILDATEVLVLEVGAAVFSIQELARRSGASVGSIYHFFSTKEAILDALCERYAIRAGCIAEKIRDGAEDWSHLELGEFVTHLLSPFMEFLRQNPAYYELGCGMSGNRTQRAESTHVFIRQALDEVFARRWPRVPSSERSIRVDVMTAIGTGLQSLMLHARKERRRAINVELSRAILGYLSRFER